MKIELNNDEITLIEKSLYAYDDLLGHMFEALTNEDAEDAITLLRKAVRNLLDRLANE